MCNPPTLHGGEAGSMGDFLILLGLEKVSGWGVHAEHEWVSITNWYSKKYAHYIRMFQTLEIDLHLPAAFKTLPHRVLSSFNQH